MHLTPEHLLGQRSLSLHSSSNNKIYKSLLEHGIAGHSAFKNIPNNLANKNNKIINLFLKNKFESLSAQVKAAGLTRFIPLKGMSLINSVYLNNGERRLTDIDILIHDFELLLIKDILLKNDFIEKNEIKWSANSHKYVFEQKNFLVNVEIELHTKLFSHISDADLKPEIKPDALSKELEFLYLCYHLAEQHNFLKLQWLYDIYLFVEQYKDELDYAKIIRLSYELGIRPSLMATVFCLKKHFKSEIPIRLELPYLIGNVLSWNFLINPDRRSLKYLRLKSYLKGQRKNQYFVGWLKHKFK